MNKNFYALKKDSDDSIVEVYSLTDSEVTAMNDVLNIVAAYGEEFYMSMISCIPEFSEKDKINSLTGEVLERFGEVLD